MIYRGSLLVVLAWGLVFTSCSGSEFASGDGGTKAASSKNKQSKDDPPDTDDKDDDKDGDKNGDQTNTETDTDTDSDADKADDDKPKAGDIVNEDQAACLLEKGDDFRILFVLDNSGSTTKTDPQNIRKSASLKLVDQFTDFVKANPKVRFRTATVAVHGTATGNGAANQPGEGATPGPNGWVDLHRRLQGGRQSARGRWGQGRGEEAA